MSDNLYECEDCGDLRPMRYGQLTEAGFECDSCYDKRIAHERDLIAIYGDRAQRGHEAIIKRNYPDLDKHAAMSEADPAGFYRACKDGTI